jgi:hypothetical protein
MIFRPFVPEAEKTVAVWIRESFDSKFYLSMSDQSLKSASRSSLYSDPDAVLAVSPASM